MFPTISRFLTLCVLAATILVSATPARAADAIARGYEEKLALNHNGLGFSVGVGGLNGLAYRRYFGGNYALQLDLFPLVADSGNYVAVYGGLTFIDYLLLWNKASRNTLFPGTTALRFVGSTGIKLSRDQSKNISVADANCATAECQSIVSQSAPLNYFAHVGLGIGVEVGAIARPGFSAAFDLQMTVMWDEQGFYAAYPLPNASLMYSW